MLNLFKEEERPLQGEEAWNRARALLVSSLNKGIVPTWEEFFRELPVLESGHELEVIRTNFLDLVEWPFLQELLALPATEFFFHSPGSAQRLLPDGSKLPIQLPVKEEDWQLWLEILSVRFRQSWNVQNPFVSFHAELFGRNYRLSLIHGSTSPLERSKLVIRALASTPHPLAAFGETEELERLVREKRNFIVAGSTGSGKTSLLTALLGYVDPREHLVVLEDTFEIITPHPHQTRFMAGPTPATSLKSYLAYSLRLSPDRIVLGEMRSHEVVPFLLAMNTGHSGLMGTIHASSAPDTLNRVALLFSLYGGEARLDFEKVMELLCRNLEYVIFMEKKKVREVIRILGADRGVPFFETLYPPSNY